MWDMEGWGGGVGGKDDFLFWDMCMFCLFE